MTGVPGRATTGGEVRFRSARARTAVGFSASVEQLSAASAAVLGWGGTVLGPMKLLGRNVVPVAELIPDAYAERVCFGSGPVLDRAEIATWVWPEMEGRVPPPAARLTGVLAPARHWRSALTAAVPFSRFTSAAIVVPKNVALAADFVSGCLVRARQFGIAVLSADGDDVALELSGRCFADAPPVEHTAVSRWVNEVVYQKLLESEVPAPSRG